MKLIRSIPLTALWIVGTISIANACDNSTVEDFSPQMAPAARSFLASLQSAVRTSDKYKIAAMVKYPLRVNDDRGHQFVRTRSEFSRTTTSSSIAR
jgi:hypothetical protein